MMPHKKKKNGYERYIFELSLFIIWQGKVLAAQFQAITSIKFKLQDLYILYVACHMDVL